MAASVDAIFVVSMPASDVEPLQGILTSNQPRHLQNGFGNAWETRICCYLGLCHRLANHEQPIYVCDRRDASITRVSRPATHAMRGKNVWPAESVVGSGCPEDPGATPVRPTSGLAANWVQSEHAEGFWLPFRRIVMGEKGRALTSAR